jgi:hypothetical protein
MITTMATRSTASTKVPLHECTNFTLHKSQLTIFRGIQNKIVDFTEHKLLKYANSVIDAQQKLELMAMTKDYRDGNIAVGWRRGSPCYIKVVKD